MPGSDWNLLTITGLQPDSPLAAAGVKVDDVPIGYKHGVETGFYGDLESVVAGEDTVIRVVARADFPRGPDAWRTVRIEGRRMTCEWASVRPWDVSVRKRTPGPRIRARHCSGGRWPKRAHVL